MIQKIVVGGVVELPDSFVSSLANIELKLVQNGTFVMGTDSTNSSSYYRVERARPKHNVTISKPFYLGIYEVTQEQWESVNGSNPSINQNWNSTEIANGTVNIMPHPVENVSPSDILGFIQALNDAEPNIILNGEQYVYDLPSEAEFEYVLRAGTTSERYYCEDNSSDCETIVGDYEWYTGNANVSATDRRAGHQIVGTLLPNPWGFHDMLGNVMEYLLDQGNPTTSCIYLQADITDPLCYSISDGNHTVRSMSIIDYFNNMYSSTRKFYDTAEFYIGFRVALVAKSVRDNMTKFANGAIIQ